MHFFLIFIIHRLCPYGLLKHPFCIILYHKAFNALSMFTPDNSKFALSSVWMAWPQRHPTKWQVPHQNNTSAHYDPSRSIGTSPQRAQGITYAMNTIWVSATAVQVPPLHVSIATSIQWCSAKLRSVRNCISSRQANCSIFVENQTQPHKQYVCL